MNKKKILYIVFSIGLIFGLTYTGIKFTQEKKENESRDLRIGYSPLIINLPLFVASKLKYFDEFDSLKNANIKLTAADTNGTMQLRDGIVNNQYDIVIALGTDMFLQQNVQDPDSLRALYFNVMSKKNYIDAFIVKQNSKINKPSDIRDKKVGGYPSPTIHKFLELYQKETGINFTLIDIMPGLEFQSLENGSIDVFFALEPFLSVAKKKNFKVIEEAPVETHVFQNPFPVGVNAVNSKFYEKNKEMVNDFQISIAKAIKYIEKNPNNAIVLGEEFLNIEKKGLFSELIFPKWELACKYKLSDSFDEVESFFLQHKMISKLTMQKKYLICNE